MISPCIELQFFLTREVIPRKFGHPTETMLKF
uniref:Uncharacterized protein n=1 Tax=Arundo donax TaxID=35708 RepID=A0A0A9F4G9_ARUDO